MNIERFKNEIEHEEALKDVEKSLKFFSTMLNIEINYYSFNEALSDYEYQFTVSENKIQKFEKPKNLNSTHYYKINKNEVKHAQLVFSKPVAKEVLQNLHKAVLGYFDKLYHSKQIVKEDYNILVVSQEPSHYENFVKEIKDNLKLNIKISHNLEEEIMIKKFIIVFVIKDEELLNKHKELLIKYNQNIIVLGPSDPQLSLFCGQFNVLEYIQEENFVLEEFKQTIKNYDAFLANKHEDFNKVICFGGISGGIGTTTIAMNTASIIAQENTDSNVLYIELSNTKGVSNLFLKKDPTPQKTIIDLVKKTTGVQNITLDMCLDSGLERISHNMFAITSIQKHVDTVYYKDEDFMLNMFGVISELSSLFNYIVIDVGEAKSTALHSNVYNLSNDIVLVTEMSIPQMTKLKTFYSLLKRAGMVNKVSFLVNNYNEDFCLSEGDSTSILNSPDIEDLKYKISYDCENIKSIYNSCKLVTEVAPDLQFVKELKEYLVYKKYIEKTEIIKKGFSIKSILGMHK